MIAKAATSTIPIVFQTGADPVKAGLVASLSRPGGNITGVTALTFELGPKRLEMLHEIVRFRQSSAIAIVKSQRRRRTARQIREMQAAAQK